MPQTLVFITGASSGIGLALAQTVPWPESRRIDISRRGAEGCEHVQADLATSEGWRTAAACFDRELRGFDGERVVFVHSAGTLQPMGPAGFVDATAYTRNVLLNSASPQILGDAFLHAVQETKASSAIVMISSGAARSVYPGWSSYGAGKAAMDQWVRTAGAEQQRIENGCRILSVAPGVVATPMQEEIRGMSPADFPEVPRFIELFEQGELREPLPVARAIWALLDRDLPNGSVVDLRDLEG